MKSQELKEALRLITKVSNDSRVGPGQGDALRKAKRELEAVARSGKPGQERVFRAVERVAAVLVELVEQHAARRSE